ncbi:MAG: restriction endonuclease [Flavobacteriaceae bacterium]|nr:restriction endonuclease [Flavobacteriaceae bacterium]
MSKKSDNFEKKIARIKSVLEKGEAEVTWNDKMPDPDNEEQPRQIDISIKKEGKLTHAECRIHKKPQDVKWIEELIGRKISLRIDSMIAVSASGFTKGAEKKAKAKGIILRNLSEVTIEEAENWGEKSEIDINWLVFKKIKITFIFPKTFSSNLPEKEIMPWIETNQKVVYEMIEKISNKYPQPTNPSDKVKRALQMVFSVSENHNQLGFLKIKIEADLEYERIREEVVQFYSYGNPNNKELSLRTTLEKNSTKSIELINTLERIGLTIDLSKIDSPENHIFKAVGWRVKRPSKGIMVNLISTFERKIAFENLVISTSIE